VHLLVANGIRFVTQVAGRIEDIPPAVEIIKQMWTGCREVLVATADRLRPVGGRPGVGLSRWIELMR
jgi:hypothetical protein